MLVSAKQQHKLAITIHISRPSWMSLPAHPSMSSQSSRLWSLCYTAAFHWLSVLHLVMCMFQCSFLNLSHPLLTPRVPILSHYVLSLRTVYENMFHSFELYWFYEPPQERFPLVETWPTGLAGILFLWHCKGGWINLNVKFLNHSTFSLKKKKKQLST